jgi:hypothetical protein
MGMTTLSEPILFPFLKIKDIDFTNQSIIVRTPKTKSLLPSLYKREELPLFGKEGRGEIFQNNVFLIMDSLVTKKKLSAGPVISRGFGQRSIHF